MKTLLKGIIVGIGGIAMNMIELIRFVVIYD